MNVKEINDTFKVGDRIVLCVCGKDCSKLGTVVQVSDELVTWILDNSVVPTSCLTSQSQRLISKISVVPTGNRTKNIKTQRTKK